MWPVATILSCKQQIVRLCCHDTEQGPPTQMCRWPGKSGVRVIPKVSHEKQDKPNEAASF